MSKFKAILHTTCLLTSSVAVALPQIHFPTTTMLVNQQPQSQNWARPTTYDDVLQLLSDIEEEKLESKYSPYELQKINAYLVLLAQQGLLPHAQQEAISIAEDTEDLMYGEDSALRLTQFLDSYDDYMITPAVLTGYAGYDIIQCGKISKAWKKTKRFLKRHKKEIIIGAVVVVAVVAIIIAMQAAAAAGPATAAGGGTSGAAGTAGTAATGAAGAAGVAGVAAETALGGTSSDGSNHPGQNTQEDAGNNGNNLPSFDAPIFESKMEEQILEFKNAVENEDFFPNSDVYQGGLSPEEIGRAIGSPFAHESFESLVHDPLIQEEIKKIFESGNISLPTTGYPDVVGFGHDEINYRFATEYGSIFSKDQQNWDFNTMAYQLKGEAAFSSGLYNQAIHDFTKAIHFSPNQSLLYLQRSASYFNTENYQSALNDFEIFNSQLNQIPIDNPLVVHEFCIGLARGLPYGLYESGEGFVFFMSDFIRHPVATSRQLVESISALVKLAADDEWGIIAEVLSPELCNVVQNWESLSSDQRGELIGFAVGKLGGDVVVPGAFAKVAAKSVTKAKQLGAICKNIKIATETLALETMSEIGSSAKVSEVISKGRGAFFLGEELGLTGSEMGQLKKVGQLESGLQNRLAHLSLSEQESIALFVKAQEKLLSHKGYFSENVVRGYIHEAGLPTFPRPKGIPENYRVRISNDGGGMLYVHPHHTHTSVRVMPGKLHSDHLCQRRPYVIFKKDGNILDKFGNPVGRKSPEAHIPIEDFVYRE